MRFVPVKSAERQGELMVLRTRELLVRQRTQAINALRGHATEFGLVAPLGVSRVQELLAKLAADPGVPKVAHEMLALLGQQIEQIDKQVSAIDVRLLAMHKANDVSRRLAQVPGIGPITAVSLALTVEAAQFESGRHLAAWLGLTPREHSSGGKQRLDAPVRPSRPRAVWPGRPRRASSSPRRSGRSCWPAPPPRAFAACGPDQHYQAGPVPSDKAPRSRSIEVSRAGSVLDVLRGLRPSGASGRCRGSLMTRRRTVQDQ